MKKARKKRISHLEYFGIVKVSEGALVPEGMYFIERETEGTWLMSLKHKKQGNIVHLGTLDLQDVMCVANKSHLANLSKDEFYEVLEKILGINFTNKLSATQDIENVFSRVASYSKQTASRY